MRRRGSCLDRPGAGTTKLAQQYLFKIAVSWRGVATESTSPSSPGARELDVVRSGPPASRRTGGGGDGTWPLRVEMQPHHRAVEGLGPDRDVQLAVRNRDTKGQTPVEARDEGAHERAINRE